MRNVTISATYTCDVCGVTTATTDGGCPSGGWKEINQKSGSALSPIKRRLYICPTCAASTDPVVLAEIRDKALRDC